MVNPDNSVYLNDILDACNRTSKFIKGISYDQFIADEKTISAVLRELIVIGEAARKTTEDFRKLHSEIPWEQIFGMRNKLVHDYMGVQLPIVWETITTDISSLKELVTKIL